MGRRDNIHRQNRRLALCGMMAALSVVILCLGGVVPMATFACPMLAMLCLIGPVCEYGTGPALLVYAAAAILGLLLGPDKELTLFYLFLGWYPCIRARLDRIPCAVCWAVKCALFTVSVTVMYLLILYLFRLDAVAVEFAEYSAAVLAGMLMLGNVTFLFFDSVLARISLLYRRKRKLDF